MAGARASLLFGIDVLLFAMIVGLLSPRLTGLPVHEWLGMALGVPVLVHLHLSWRWIDRSVAGALGARRWRTRVNLLLNVALFVLVVLEVCSGVAISMVALPALHLPSVNDRVWRAVHNQSLNAFTFAVGLHIAVNWSTLRRYLSRRRVRA